jgi:hypothetical protein
MQLVTDLSLVLMLGMTGATCLPPERLGQWHGQGQIYLIFIYNITGLSIIFT